MLVSNTGAATVTLLLAVLHAAFITAPTADERRAPPDTHVDVYSTSSLQFGRQLAAANSHDRLLHLLRGLQSGAEIDPDVGFRFLGERTRALVHACRLHIFMRTAVNRTAAEARGQDFDVALKVATALLEAGADPDLTGTDCLPPLLYSAWAKDATLMWLLLKHGARCAGVDMGLQGSGSIRRGPHCR
jgi:hypothetical protein